MRRQGSQNTPLHHFAEEFNNNWPMGEGWAGRRGDCIIFEKHLNKKRPQQAAMQPREDIASHLHWNSITNDHRMRKAAMTGYCIIVEFKKMRKG
jgi:hypothetical protein